MKIPPKLLAKSYDRDKYQQPPDYALYIQHNRDVAAACKALAKIVGAIALKNAGLDPNLIDEFSKTLLANGWIQDLGKGNSHFQEMLSGKPELIQLLRHETISGLLACLEPRFVEWLAPLGKAKFIAVWGAMGHHRKFDARTVQKDVTELTVYVTHEDFKTNLQEMAQDLGLSEPPLFESDLVIAPKKYDICNLAAEESLNQIKALFNKLESEFKDELSRRFVALIKAFGIAADGSASGVAKKYKHTRNYSLAAFVVENLSQGLKPSDLTTLINAWAWNNKDVEKEQIDLTKLPDDFEFREFQKKVEASQSFLTLALAGCGSGKSIAAYLWGRRWCEKLLAQGRNNTRIFFCLPTTGTTTEHFKDYALESGIPPELISLTHSRSSVDLETMAKTSNREEANEKDENDTTKAAEAALKAERDKIEGLALWSTPLVVTTADTVLGLMVNSRRAIYSTPAIMQSVIVFDEVHAFDDYLFGHLLVFLKNFPYLPVLLMTASLPEQRRQAIEQVRPDVFYVPGDEKLEILPRYKIQYPTDFQQVWDAVKECVANNGKVLWVKNQVEWANVTYTQVKEKFPNIYVNVYHSRLRYKDRSDRHRQVIDNFKLQGQAAILVATQVAEMSLDLSADLLITDIAPVPALIQRMGRLNRRATPETPGHPKPALICQLPTDNEVKPYEKKDIEITETWIHNLLAKNKSLSQRDLAQEFVAVSNEEEYNYKTAKERACFFGIPKKSGLWRTRPGFTRCEGYTISVILEADYEAWQKQGLSGNPDADWIRKHEVAIPIRKDALNWPQVGGIRIAPKDAVTYDYDEVTKEGTGARWL
ncbi:CRISPR-associated helicase Cas3' [Nostoc sp. FACHB-190]|uniref:CRISPR-associated helicase Cas3' n=1 Tax=Nostoc sp. FACHB-190 TaxID=2692838 RepID=UPI0016875618|nr:CRISPR-associated helicase Cas3' [Nostoc sp. FACHB-190]MBD2301543.1 CRISPR-associated helicase Cas3' [Nostoc sp. FACHB-190]